MFSTEKSFYNFCLKWQQTDQSELDRIKIQSKFRDFIAFGDLRPWVLWDFEWILSF